MHLHDGYLSPQVRQASRRAGGPGPAGLPSPAPRAAPVRVAPPAGDDSLMRGRASTWNSLPAWSSRFSTLHSGCVPPGVAVSRRNRPDHRTRADLLIAPGDLAGATELWKATRGLARFDRDARRGVPGVAARNRSVGPSWRSALRQAAAGAAPARVEEAAHRLHRRPTALHHRRKGRPAAEDRSEPILLEPGVIR